MSVSVKVKLIIPPQAIPRMERFSRKQLSKALRQAGNEASKAMLPVLKSNTPVGKKEYGGGSLKKSLGRKVKIKGGRMWAGAGPRTKWEKVVTKKIKYWRDNKGRIRKAPLVWQSTEKPSRRAHLSEKKTQFVSRTSRQTRAKTQAVVTAALTEAVEGT